LLKPLDDCEITLEANPADITKSKTEYWKKININRISMGCQSMRDDELKYLGRRHNKAGVIAAVDILRSTGIENISLDLIYGLPMQTTEAVKDSIKQLIKLNPEHISSYCLSLDEGCRLYSQKNKLPDEDKTNDMYYMLVDILAENSYKLYEISNFSKAGKESKHNLSYWQQKYYLACGPAAAGYLTGFRYQNPADLNAWAIAIRNEEYFANKDVITPDIEESEYIMLSLRLAAGIDLEDYRNKFKKDFREKYAKELAKYLELKLMVINDKRAKLCKAGYFISNEIIKDFI
jgi:oxygen-independent coproporphyrinogen-3 oxidase